MEWVRGRRGVMGSTGNSLAAIVMVSHHGLATQEMRR